MATKNGNILTFKTSKLKEHPKIGKLAQNPGSVNVLSAGAIKQTSVTPNTTAIGGATMSNGIKITNTPLATAAGGSGNISVGSKRIWPTLPSFAPPRDLTLGGRAPKKVFTPNLNAVRNKNLNVKTSKDTTAKRGGGTGRGGRGSGRGAAGGRGGKASTLIQTKGVFSEGAGEFNARRSSSYSRYGGSGGNEDSSPAIQKPVLNKVDKKKIDIKADEKKLYEITGESDEEECFDYDKMDATEDDLPIRLNEAERKVKLQKMKAIKKEILPKEEEIKTEFFSDDDYDVSASTATHKLQKLHVDSKDIELQDPLDGHSDAAHHSALPRYPKSVVEFIDSTKTQLLLLQLPDILPCETETDSKDFIFKKEQKSLPTDLETSSGTTRLNLKSDYNWKAMQEGQIGKILRYKSGKVRLLLGKTLFDLDVAMEPGFMQDVISIKTNEDYEHSTGSMINMGPIHAKINATPYWEDCMHHFEAEEIPDNA